MSALRLSKTAVSKTARHPSSLSRLLDAQEARWRKRDIAKADSPASSRDWPNAGDVLRPIQIRELPHVVKPTLEVAATAVPSEHRRMGAGAGRYGSAMPILSET
jgi:hypothetical protein